MDINAIIIAVAVIGLLGLFIGLFLGIAGLKLNIKTDPKEEAVLNALPGNNCGGCGYAGCAQMAKAIAAGEAPVNGCPVGGDSVGKVIAEIMGTEAGESVRTAAFVRCNGNCENAAVNYIYSGAQDCNSAFYAPGKGPKACSYGCTGLGTCVKVCPFDAISIIGGIAVVDSNKCKACGKCVEACPKHLIELVPVDSKYRVACFSRDKGPVAMKNCKVSCIACGLCVKNCPNEAVTVENNIASIDYEKCRGCGICKEKCPKKAIIECNEE